jgi:hypothetical protein
VDPGRLARSWHPRLPGAAVLALERASRGIGDGTTPATAEAATEPATEPKTEPKTEPAVEVEVEAAAGAGRALERGLRARRDRARAALRDVKRLLASAEIATARDAMAAARDLAAPLADPTLRAWIAIFESEMAAAARDLWSAAAFSCAAEDLAQRASDEATYLAVWWLRAVRALRRGDGGVGELTSRWMRTWLVRVAPRALTRLDCVAAAFALDDHRADAAIEIAAAVVAAVPGTHEAGLAGSIVAQAFLVLDRPTDAARIATSSIERCPGLPPALAARLYHDAATALEATGVTDVAARSSALARALDPEVDRATTPADFAAAGIELRLL